MDYSVKDFYIPTITYFDSGNKLTGSRNGMNYKMTPQKEEKEIRVQIWYGEWNLEHSDLIASRLFPMIRLLRLVSSVFLRKTSKDGT